MMRTAYEVEFEQYRESPWLLVDPRVQLCRKYSWAIPCEEALRVLSGLGPIVEGGAGSGYWASLLRERGVDVVAYDAEPYQNHWIRSRWSDVQVGSAEQMRQHKDRTLLLVWPPYAEEMALSHVLAHGGNTVVYVGEWRGCTGNDAFHRYLEGHFDMVQVVNIPQWCGMQDAMWVLTRKP